MTAPDAGGATPREALRTVVAWLATETVAGFDDEVRASGPERGSA